ncbi:Fructosamine kinase-domain-containing protein [Cadophora sp. MPI-SDFR-AT-0126]|nr:Fructosamine kinase-domain-containing protein [Leotiomycetes sp. MPI-SDFR-AT-0126]
MSSSVEYRYTGPALPNRARNMVATLTEVPGHALDDIDENVIACMPEGSKVVSFSRHGAAYWTRTAAIKTIQPDGTPLDFFLKVAHAQEGKGMLVGEFESMQAIYAILPEYVPKPIAHGTYASDPKLHFFLMALVDMTNEVAEVETLPKLIADMHIKGTSPNGKYGFHVPTNEGALQQPNTWADSWEAFFTDLFKRLFNFEQEIHGENEEMQSLYKDMIDKVIPRLLRPLETGGNEIKPALIHADLWDGNTTTDAVTGNPIIFDASSCYGHSEFEIAAWTPPRHRLSRPYIREYLKYVQRSEPKEDFEDRLVLYRVRFDLTASAAYLNNMRLREGLIADMRHLVDKFPNGYEGPHKQKGSE